MAMLELGEKSSWQSGGESLASFMRPVSISLSKRDMLSERVLKVAGFSWKRAERALLLVRETSGLGSLAILTIASNARAESADTMKTVPSAWLVRERRNSQ